MGCCCVKIRNCKHDIDVLNKCDEYTRQLKSLDSDVEEKLNTLSRLYTTTFTVTNMAGLVSENNQINDRLSELFIQMNGRIKDQVALLESDLRNMESEDEAYHREQREKHHHHHHNN